MIYADIEEGTEKVLQSKRGVIYCIWNEINGHRYIGKTKNTFWRRYSNGKWWCQTGNSALKADVAIHGKEAFHVYILEEGLSQEELIRLEAEYISSLNTVHPNGYNLTYYDQDGNQVKAALAIKNILLGKAKKAERLLSEGIVTKRKPRSQAECLAISLRTRGKNNPRFGIKMSEETKNKIRHRATGRVASSETRDKLRLFVGERANHIRTVVQINPNTKEIVREFSSAALAARAVGTKRGNITGTCAGRQKTSKGFQWAYKDSYETT